MTHELKDFLELLFCGAAAVAAIVFPFLTRGDVKKELAISWGEVKATVVIHGERLESAEQTIKEHGEAIGYLKGKANGAAGGSRFV